MKRILPLFFFLLLGLSTFANAGSHLGGEISYQRLTKYSYLVRYTHYSDCQATAVPTTFSLNVKAPGCNTGWNVTLNQLRRKLGKPYGTTSPLTCPGPATPMFEIVTYSGVVNFTSADAKCRNWVLSVSSSDRTEAENIVANPSNANFYTEAHLRLNYAVNSSPVFDTLSSPLMYVNYGTEYTLSMAAKDPDGDSLVYSLVAPLVNQNQWVVYSTSQFQNPILPPGYIMNPNPKPPYSNPFHPQLAQIQIPNPTTFSHIFPIFSIKVDWNGPPTVPMPNAPFQPYIWAANPYFVLNGSNGYLKFIPLSYTSNTQNLPRNNKFLVSILVEEYRKINGVPVKLGSVRRETLIQVFNNNSSLDPNAPASQGQVNNQRTSNVTNTPEAFGTAKFTAFPNPFSEELTFNFNLNSKAESIVIYNLLGQKVDEIPLKTLSSGEQKVQWENARNFAAGTYVARLISTDKTVQTLKFTKQH